MHHDHDHDHDNDSGNNSGNAIRLATLSEDFDQSEVMFCEADERATLYASNDYRPCSVLHPLVWQDPDNTLADIPALVEKGDKVVSRELAELIMAFDPYGVECYPVELDVADGRASDRFILAVNNILDVSDRQRSRIIKNPKPHRPDIISRLAICPEKLRQLPLSRRLVFRVKESNTVFFADDIARLVIDGLQQGRFPLTQATPFDTSECAPLR